MALLLLLALLGSGAAQTYVAQYATCGDLVAAGHTGPCLAPVSFPAGAQSNGYPIPAAWQSPPVCYTQYLQNQLATPTFMPSNSTCSAYANAGCCSSETTIRCARQRASAPGGARVRSLNAARLRPPQHRQQQLRHRGQLPGLRRSVRTQ